MKKIVSLVLAVIMLLSVCAFASAEDKFSWDTTFSLNLFTFTDKL